ncbi:MAG: TonB-dependent receptor [Vicinamibacterales bacterium]
MKVVLYPVRTLAILLVGALCASVVAVPVYAQGGTATATLSGRVVDDTQGVLPGTTVTVTNLATNQARTVVTNEEGRFTFAGLQPGRYSLSCELPGFATFLRPEITLNVGSLATIDAVMRVSTLQETVTVTGEAPIIESARTDLSTVINREQIETLPTNSRNYLDFTLLTPATVENVSTTAQGVGLNVGGSRAKEGSLLVDGFWNTDESFTFPRLKYSQDAIAEFQVVSMGGTAEFGRAIGGIVNAVTKSGTNALSGSGYGYFRDTSLSSQDPLSKQRGAPKSEFQRQLYGGSLGGPVVRDRTFFFGAAERLQEDTPQDNNITAESGRILGLPAEDIGAITGTLRDTFAMGKVNHRLTENHSVQLAYVITKDVNASSFASFGTRSRRSRLTSTDQAYQAQWTGIAAGGQWLHELRGSYFPRDYTLDMPNVGGPPLTTEGQLRDSGAPSVNITRVANFGSGRLQLEMMTRPWHVIYSSTISKSNHAIKFGVDGMFVDFVYLRYAGPATGSYNFASIAAFQQGRYTTYSQTFGEPRIDRYHSYVSGYVQDSWTATDRLTLNLGLRYDLEWLSKYQGLAFGDQDRNNFGPRVALSYDLTGRGKTIAKFSNGIYYDRIFQNPITPTFFENRDVLQQVSATWNFGQPGAPVYPQTFPNALPASASLGVRNVFIVPEQFSVPAAYQAVGSVDHAFRDDFAVGVSVLYSRGWDKEVLFDRNLVFNEATQRFTRPDPNFRAIRQYSYEGKAEYTGLVLEARKRMTRRFFFSTNATIARAFDQGDNFSTQVEDPRFPEREYGTQVDTPRFRMTANGSYEINRFASVSAIFKVRTGFAHDARSGSTVDLNNDGNFNDRVPGFSRNDFRMPGTHSLDMRFTWNLPFGGARRLQATVEAFNIYNRDNVRTVDNQWGINPATPGPGFGTPLSYFNPREVQLGLRFAF